MALNSQIVSVRYAGNNSILTAYAVPFRFIAAEDVSVVVSDIAGAEVALQYGAEYAVTGAGNPAGGALTTVAPIPTTSTVTIFRAMDALQPYSYEEGQKLRMKTMEGNFDHIVLPVQQLQAGLPPGQRALTFSAGESSASLSTIPPVDQRRGRFMFFNEYTGAMEFLDAAQVRALIGTGGGWVDDDLPANSITLGGGGVTLGGAVITIN